jgi:hypothetical protein
MLGMSKHTLRVRILSCGGTQDLMSEQEAVFLNSSLGLFRNVRDIGRATPRAQASMVRAYKPEDALSAFSASDDLLHLIAHGVSAKEMATRARLDPTISADDDRAPGPGIQVGIKAMSAKRLREEAERGLRLPEIVVSTVCGFDGAVWHSVLRELGVKLVIASGAQVTPANLASFDMAFYSALLARVRKGKSTIDRVEHAFDLARAHYSAIHAIGTPKVTFRLTRL